ncbi:hypothetical protein KK062_05800 [Fulvivirgaceae bacterium PWU5]|uniref:Uncharacterized protein n=2 Tax=Dawidia cretensis TaxID=2782350 RepID=A0AAP2DX56_9BACT|nr:hypothetical protein [Dawidia cretensis]
MVFNTIGYYSFLVLLKEQMADRLSRKIASGVPEPGGDMILKIPLAVPYTTGSEEYESSKGEFTYDGTVYRILKQKHYNDTLYVVCIHDYKATQVANQIKDLSHAFAGDGSHGTGLKLIDSLSKYYCFTRHTILSLSAGWSLGHTLPEPSHHYSCRWAEIIFHPPETNA